MLKVFRLSWATFRLLQMNLTGRRQLQLLANGWPHNCYRMGYIMTFEQQLNDIVADRESGSSQLVARIQEAFHSLEDNNPDEHQLRWAFTQLRQIDHSMAVVHHLIDALEPEVGPGFFQALQEYQRHWEELPNRVAAELMQVRNWSNSNILLHSRSGMLLEAVKQIGERYDDLIVWQTRSEPGGEGVAQYRDLQKLNVAVHLVEDDQVPELVARTDAAWLGVDQYNEKAFVNKLGSKHITHEMSSAGKTTFVLGDPRKRVERLNFSTELFEAVPFCPDTVLVNGDINGNISCDRDRPGPPSGNPKPD